MGTAPSRRPAVVAPGQVPPEGLWAAGWEERAPWLETGPPGAGEAVACPRAPGRARPRLEVRRARGPEGPERAGGLGAWCARAARSPQRAGRCGAAGSERLPPAAGAILWGDPPPRVSCSGSARSWSGCGRAEVPGRAAVCGLRGRGSSFSGRRLEARTWSAAAGWPSRPPAPRGAAEPRASSRAPSPRPRPVPAEAPARSGCRGAPRGPGRAIAGRARSGVRVFPDRGSPCAPAQASEARPEGGSDFPCSALRWRLPRRASPAARWV